FVRPERLRRLQRTAPGWLHPAPGRIFARYVRAERGITMIGFFPEPYPDELCYSLCARYCRRAGYRGRISTVRDLFGSGSFRAVVDMPSRPDSLIASLPPGHGYTVDRFIDEHTLLPFYAAFFPPKRVARVRAEMRQSSGQAKAHILAGLSEIAKRFEYL